MQIRAQITKVNDEVIHLHSKEIKKRLYSKLNENKEYLINIQDIESKRTLRQNAFIWEIIGQIDKKVNGYLPDELGIYKQLIEQAKIKTVFLETIEEAEKELKKVFRFVEKIEDRVSEKGVETVLYRCYYGTSKFTKKEMTDFIEVLINRAYAEGIDVCGYEELLKGVKQ